MNSLRVTSENFESCNSCKRKPAVYVSCLSQNFRLLHVSNLSVRKLSNFSDHVSGVCVTDTDTVIDTVTVTRIRDRRP